MEGARGIFFSALLESCSRRSFFSSIRLTILPSPTSCGNRAETGGRELPPSKPTGGSEPPFLTLVDLKEGV
jgi:hypothetical protein